MSFLTLPVVRALLTVLAGMLPGLRLGGSPLALAGAAFAVLAGLVAWPRVVGERVPAPAVRRALLVALSLAGGALGAQARHDAAADCRARWVDGQAVEVRGLLAANRMPPADSAARPPMVPLRVLSA
ncbi:MAG: hypothetical protein JWM27_4964, partial [Gemmatimonadetes bacterium]|nr:hypothetical protein [Gemmatimonadota bacterium]